MTQIIAKCKAGHVVRATSEQVVGGWVKCGCGQSAVAKWMKISLVERECSGVCTAAVGPACSCSCGGANHGHAKIFSPAS